MITLIINGSPRANGDTVSLINMLKKNLNGEIYIVNACSGDIKPCDDCRYCNKSDKCIIEDKMQDIYSLIQECDNIILASPLYFSELSWCLLMFASRLQHVYMSWKNRGKFYGIKPKEGGVIIVGGGSTRDTSKAENTASIILKTMGADNIKTISSLQTDKIPAAQDQSAIRQIADFAQMLNRRFTE